MGIGGNIFLQMYGQLDQLAGWRMRRNRVSLIRHPFPFLGYTFEAVQAMFSGAGHDVNKPLTLTKPESMTNLIPSMVTLASAILVATTTFRVSLGGGANIACCSSGDKPPCSGIGIRRGAAFGRLSSHSEHLEWSLRAWRNIRYGPICDLLRSLFDFLPPSQEYQNISLWLL